VDVHILGWIGLAAIILTLIVIDIVGHVRTPHEPTMKEAAVWSVAYIGMALVFGGIVWFVWGGGFAQEYLAGYITEKALSIDNLFVFVIMMSSFKVPRKYQQEVLLAGIVIALILRLIFILAGAALIENFSWVFYFFGAWLLWTAFSQAREGVQEPDEDDEEYKPSGFVKLVARVIPMTDGFVGGKPELLGCTADTRHRRNNVFFTRGGIVAQNVDGIAELLDLADWELEHVSNRRGGISRLFRAHPKGNRHLGRDGGKFRQLLNRDAKLSARCGKIRHFGGGNAQFGAHFLQLV